MISTAIWLRATEPNAAGVPRFEITVRPPEQDATVILFSTHDRPLADEVETAIRRAYAQGRKDERRQTAAVLRSLMGD
jgi:hypothetical protein